MWAPLIFPRTGGSMHYFLPISWTGSPWLWGNTASQWGSHNRNASLPTAAYSQLIPCPVLGLGGCWGWGYRKAGCCVLSHSAVSDSLQPHGLQPTRLLCPWDSPGKDAGVGCHALLQGIFPIQGLNPGLLHCRQVLYCLSQQGIPKQDGKNIIVMTKKREIQGLRQIPPRPDLISPCPSD